MSIKRKNRNGRHNFLFGEALKKSEPAHHCPAGLLSPPPIKWHLVERLQLLNTPGVEIQWPRTPITEQAGLDEAEDDDSLWDSVPIRPLPYEALPVRSLLFGPARVLTGMQEQQRMPVARSSTPKVVMPHTGVLWRGSMSGDVAWHARRAAQVRCFKT
jgi:hypothetical protein